MSYTTYDPITGEIQTTTFGDYESVMSEIAGKFYVEGAYNSQEYYVDINTQQLISKGPRPTPNSLWDINTKTWIADNQKDIDDARQQRNIYLSGVDRVNPIWYASLTELQQQELAAYRQQLLDVPQQSGFPTNVVWPTKPAWL